MILQCPSCHARFMVADALIPPEGRTVKCGRCAHQWFTEGPPPVAAPEPDFAQLVEAAQQTNPLPPEESAVETPAVPAQVPAPRPFNIPLLPFKIAVPVLAIAWFVIALYAYFPDWQRASGFSGIYGALGVTDMTGIVFNDVTMEKQPLEGKTRFVLTGSLANHDAVAHTVPRVRVQLKDAQNKVIWSRIYPVEAAVEPGTLYPFRIEDVETSFADQVVSIVLDVGNKFELVMR